jgi:anti-sigma28 factor (negative regulator of flagellin synthesis)
VNEYTLQENPMKIENNNMLPLSARPAEAANLIEKKDDLTEVTSVRPKQDSVEMSDNARLLAKARTALGNVDETNSEQILALKSQVESGDYTVQVNQLAIKLAARLNQK